LNEPADWAASTGEAAAHFGNGNSGQGGLVVAGMIIPGVSGSAARNAWNRLPNLDDLIRTHGGLRQAYEAEVRELSSLVERLRKAGLCEEQIAREMYRRRNELKAIVLARTPPHIAEAIRNRNMMEYGKPHGPTFEYLRSKGKSFADIIESASRPGGTDIPWNLFR
jgi:hypothetical protein